MDHEKLTRIEEKLNKIDDKIDKIVDKIHETNIVLAENTQSLIIHEKRTDIAEAKLGILEIEFKEYAALDRNMLSELQKQIEPISKHVTIINTTVKYIIPAAAGILVFLYKIGIFKY